MAEQVSVTCCIAGGGPAGMMLGFLLARAGIDVLVLEKHRDFLRDFRGDTIHPSTLDVIDELGLLPEFLRLPHQEVAELAVRIGDETMTIADFRHLPTRCKFIALMPQWDFLNFLAKQAARHPAFKLRMSAEVTDLVVENGRIVGLRAMTEQGSLAVRAALVIAADGRHSIVRQKSGLPIEELGAPMDVLWFALSRHPGDSSATAGRFDAGQIFVLINRGDHWQCGLVIPKGAYAPIQGAGLPAFWARVVALTSFGDNRAEELKDWDQIKLLTVRVDRLTEWSKPGLLCIGDAAHAMSPVGGVGINLAIQDAVAAANLLARPLARGELSTDHLRRVQQRRMFPTRVTQRLQVLMQERIITNVLRSRSGKLTVPFMLRLFSYVPALRRIPARLIGVGIRPEHVKTPDRTDPR